MGHIFMTLTKSDQFCDPPPTPTFAKMNDRSIVCNGMAKHVTSFKTFPTPRDLRMKIIPLPRSYFCLIYMV